MASEKVIFVAVCIILVGLVVSYPAPETDSGEEDSDRYHGHHNHSTHNEDDVLDNNKVTCDLLGGMGIGPISLGVNTLCALHCGQIKCKSGGSCKDGVCVCRKSPASCWIYLCKGCKW
ncbi:defensin-1-like isoform X2 [Paramacrobiotus metropolitanus]|uniref:defensin-1-like isoform X2 n=1 Tax=Paramacrobiotus metropolitanus TaxID=2943436 RepID=UPI002445DE1E|nr:defensin-1-like isoform X2 [Paramacrobiotus metropolitanus]